MKDNLGQECEKGALLSFQGKIGTIAPDFLENMSFPALTLLSACPSLKSGFSTHTKLHFFLNEQ